MPEVHLDPNEVGPPADIIVEGDRIHITLSAQGVPEADLAYYLGSNVLLVWDRRRPEEARTIVHLPESVDPETAQAQVTNNVLDLSARRAPERDRRAGDATEPATRTPRGEDA